MKRIFFALAIAICAITANAEPLQVVRVNKQHHFSRTVPAGNYSGIAWLGGNRYAVVDDKAPMSGYHIMEIDIDSVSGDITNVSHKAFVSCGGPNGDEEGIALRAADSSLWISSEAHGTVKQSIGGKYTGRELDIPEVMRSYRGNYGFESLTHNDSTHLFWITTESTLPCDGEAAKPGNGVRNRLRLQSFGNDLLPQSMWWYTMDAPQATATPLFYAMGVSELTALDDGSLLVLEREFFVPKSKLGAWCQVKIYQTFPCNQPAGSELRKELVAEWKTNLTLLGRSLANYEGMCLGPTLSDGSRVLVLVSDSQNQYAHVLRDWFRTIVVK